MTQKAPFHYEDEIDLIDLFIILVRRKWIIIAMAVMAVVAAIVLGQLTKRSQVHQYNTPIEIGSLVINDELKSLDSAEDLGEKIKQAYKPLLEAQTGSNLDLDVTIPKRSNILVITSSGAKGELDKFSDIHKKLLHLIRKREEQFAEDLGAERVSYTHVLNATTESSSDARSFSFGFLIILGLVTGTVLGIISAFFVEFVSYVRNGLKSRLDKS